MRFYSSGKVDFSVHVKDTQIWEPLSPTSAHPSHVHMNWPSGMVTRIRRLCSQSSVARSEIRAFVSRLDLFCFDSKHPCNRKPEPFTRLVLPYHSMWAGLGASSIIARARDRAGLTQLPEAQVGVGWRLLGRHVGQKIVSLCTSLHKCTDGDPTFHTVWRLEG